MATPERKRIEGLEHDYEELLASSAEYERSATASIENLREIVHEREEELKACQHQLDDLRRLREDDLARAAEAAQAAQRVRDEFEKKKIEAEERTEALLSRNVELETNLATVERDCATLRRAGEDAAAVRAMDIVQQHLAERSEKEHVLMAGLEACREECLAMQRDLMLDELPDGA